MPLIALSGDTFASRVSESFEPFECLPHQICVLGVQRCGSFGAENGSYSRNAIHAVKQQRIRRTTINVPPLINTSS